jgi:radical SAM superfamily enzyme YgiQ (UPF0313 family)
MFIHYVAAQSPLGIGYLSSRLAREGYRIDCLNLYLGLSDIEALGQYISRTKPKIIGISSMTENYQNGLLLAKYIKKIHPDITTMFGGPHVTFMYEEALANDCVDIVARREAEETIVELADHFVRGKGSLDNIKGIAYRSNGTVVRTANRPMIKNLDSLPFPTRRIPDLDGIIDFDPNRSRQVVITSRGCPGRCKFCSAAALSGGKHRLRSIDNIANELEALKARGARAVFFGDDTISSDVSRLLGLCEMLKDLDLIWDGECRVDAMTEELAKKLADSGCKGLQFGVESGSQELIDKTGKDITLQQVEQAVSMAVDAGILVLCSVLVGLPEDTATSIEQTIDFAVRLQTKYEICVMLSCLVPYPGTYYFNHAEELGITISTANYDLWSTVNPVMDLPHLTRWQIRNAFYEGNPRLYRSLSEKYKYMRSYCTYDSLAKEGYDVTPSQFMGAGSDTKQQGSDD